MKLFKVFIHIIIIIILTTTTQIGGIIWLLAVLISKKKNWKKRIIFPLLYLTCNLIIIPPIARAFGRVPLPVFSKSVTPINWCYPLAFRNYVTPELRSVLTESAKDNNITITYLDANFPLFNGFPLLPHLSHNDGKKVDIAFQYQTKDGKSTDKKPSLSGYGIFTNSKNPTNTSCKNQGFWQYDMTKYVGIPMHQNLELDKKATKSLIKSLLSKQVNSKLFIEPYLKRQLGLKNYNQIRFHGCRAVRHDDHIHFQIE